MPIRTNVGDIGTTISRGARLKQDADAQTSKLIIGAGKSLGGAIGTLGRAGVFGETDLTKNLFGETNLTRRAREKKEKEEKRQADFSEDLQQRLFAGKADADAFTRGEITMEELVKRSAPTRALFSAEGLDEQKKRNVLDLQKTQDELKIQFDERVQQHIRVGKSPEEAMSIVRQEMAVPLRQAQLKLEQLMGITRATEVATDIAEDLGEEQIEQARFQTKLQKMTLPETMALLKAQTTVAKAKAGAIDETLQAETKERDQRLRLLTEQIDRLESSLTDREKLAVENTLKSAIVRDKGLQDRIRSESRRLEILQKSLGDTRGEQFAQLSLEIRNVEGGVARLSAERRRLIESMELTIEALLRGKQPGEKSSDTSSDTAKALKELTKALK